MASIRIRRKPKGIYKVFSRIPGYLYQLGLSKPFEANTLILTTRGRLSGKEVRMPLGYGRKGNTIYIAALYENSDWYRNALKNPVTNIQIGKERIRARASEVKNPEEKAEAYREIVRTQGKGGAEKYYYVKPGMDDEEIGIIGKSLPIMRFEVLE